MKTLRIAAATIVTISFASCAGLSPSVVPNADGTTTVILTIDPEQLGNSGAPSK